MKNENNMLGDSRLRGNDVVIVANEKKNGRHLQYDRIIHIFVALIINH